MENPHSESLGLWLWVCAELWNFSIPSTMGRHLKFLGYLYMSPCIYIYRYVFIYTTYVLRYVYIYIMLYVTEYEKIDHLQ